MSKVSFFSVAFLAFITIGIGQGHAQQARIAGLEKNEEYMDLLKEQQKLKTGEDSTLSLISQNRKAFEAIGSTTTGAEVSPEQRAERGKYGQEIVRLEGELFEIRNKIGQITAQVSMIEQDYILNHMDDQGVVALPEGDEEQPVQETKKQLRTLFANDFFVENLTKNEMTLFRLTPQVEPEVIKINGKIHQLYQQLDSLKQHYDKVNNQEIVDSLAGKAVELKEQIEQEDALMEKLWLAIYNRKMEAYPVLLDKMGGVDRIVQEQLDQESRMVRRAEGLASEQLAPLVSTFPMQKRLALDYEIAMAQKLGLTEALDSLKAEGRKIPEQQTMTYPDIHFQPRNLVVYSPIAKPEDHIPTAEAYAAVSDIPEMHIPKKGIYYTIQLGAFTTVPKTIETFKGMSPLRWQKMSDGRTRYVVGGFRNYADAQAALTQMQRAGFRAPTMVAWMDGKLTTSLKAKAEEDKLAAASGSANGKEYNVEIVPGEGRLSTALRNVITSRTSGGISIVRNSRGNEAVYSVGSFAVKAEADKLAEALRAESNVQVKVVEL